jgi:hypothetical protein
MVLEAILVVVVLPLVAVGLSLAWSERVGGRRADEDAEVEAAGMLRPGR